MEDYTVDKSIAMKDGQMKIMASELEVLVSSGELIGDKKYCFDLIGISGLSAVEK
jgi:hypothetical protein